MFPSVSPEIQESRMKRAIESEASFKRRWWWNEHVQTIMKLANRRSREVHTKYRVECNPVRMYVFLLFRLSGWHNNKCFLEPGPWYKDDENVKQRKKMDDWFMINLPTILEREKYLMVNDVKDEKPLIEMTLKLPGVEEFKRVKAVYRSDPKKSDYLEFHSNVSYYDLIENIGDLDGETFEFASHFLFRSDTDDKEKFEYTKVEWSDDEKFMVRKSNCDDETWVLGPDDDEWKMKKT